MILHAGQGNTGRRFPVPLEDASYAGWGNIVTAQIEPHPQGTIHLHRFQENDATQNAQPISETFAAPAPLRVPELEGKPENDATESADNVSNANALIAPPDAPELEWEPETNVEWEAVESEP
jgi:hypothetical protein